MLKLLRDRIIIFTGISELIGRGVENASLGDKFKISLFDFYGNLFSQGLAGEFDLSAFCQGLFYIRLSQPPVINQEIEPKPDRKALFINNQRRGFLVNF